VIAFISSDFGFRRVPLTTRPLPMRMM